MMLKKILFSLLLGTLGLSTFAGVDDSTGVILKDGRVFILHKVENGQGIFGVARRYKIDWTLVKAANPGSDTKLLPGQTLIVPTGKTEQQFFGNKVPKYSKIPFQYSKPIKNKDVKAEVPTSPSPVENSKKETFTHSYTIAKGESLFSVAKKFNTTPDFLMQLNKLNTDQLDEGLTLLVPINDANTAKQLVKEKELEVEKIKDDINATIFTIKTEKKRLIANDTTQIKTIEKENTPLKLETPLPKPQKTTSEYTITIENFPEYDVEKVTENGLGKLANDPNINQSKDWVMHHNAPENTIILITNPANNKTVYVKVIKNFKRDEKDAVIVFITKKTADYLEVNKKDKFNIKLSFAK